MKCPLFLLAACLLPLAPVSSPGIVDTDGNGLSDVFELQYNNGQPLDPNADPDGDGWTNASEFAASTNPFDANAPNGYVRPSVTDTITTSSEPDGNGGTVISTLHTIQVAWPTKPGVKYTLLYSADLAPESWQPVDDPATGTGAVMEFNFPLTNPTKTFWRVKMDEVDTDSDGVTDTEEIALGLDQYTPNTLPGLDDHWLAGNFTAALMAGGKNAVNPNSDSDGDGLTNAQEQTLGTNPLIADTDQDGLRDGEEIDLGSNPKKADTDGDKLNDPDDAVPNDREINWPKTPEARYIWIEQVSETETAYPPLAVNKHGQILFHTGSHFGGAPASRGKGLWDSATRDWVDLQSSGSQSVDTGDTTTNMQDPLNEYIDINDDGTVYGISTGENHAPVDPLIPGMLWKRTQESLTQYGAPIYIFPVVPIPVGQSVVNALSNPDLRSRGGIANDGSVNTTALHSAAPAPGQEWMIFPGDSSAYAMTSVKAIPTGTTHIGTYAGAILDKKRALYIETLNGAPISKVFLKDGTGAATDISFMANTVVYDTEIALAPTPKDNDGGERLWLSIEGKTFLEKRAGGSGAGRWHQPLSMGEAVIRLRANGEAITRGTPAQDESLAVPPKIWRNGKYTDLNDLTSKPAGVDIIKAFDLASNGIILAQAEVNGVIKTGLLIPIWVSGVDKDVAPIDKTATDRGVDNISINAKKLPGNGAQDDMWIMAPDTGSNPVRFISGASNLFPIELVVDLDGNTLYSTSILNSPDKIVNVEGIGADRSERVLRIRIDGTKYETPIKTKVVKKRTVKIAIWNVPSKQKDGTAVAPHIMLNKQEMDQYLNEIFGPQVGLEFDCSVTNTTPLEFDNADGTAYGAPAAYLPKWNGWLDSDNFGTAEAKTVSDSFYDDAASANIYILGGVLGVRSHSWNQHALYFSTARDFAAGKTILKNRTCFLASSYPLDVEFPDSYGLKDTVVHEIGHIILGEGHPDLAIVQPNFTITTNDGGVAPLVGANPLIRLMCSGLSRHKDGTSQTMVKGEWDVIDEWIKNEIKEDRISQ